LGLENDGSWKNGGEPSEDVGEWGTKIVEIINRGSRRHQKRLSLLTPKNILSPLGETYCTVQSTKIDIVISWNTLRMGMEMQCRARFPPCRWAEENDESGAVYA
jgi:hypothetical protein